jgi:hypothetical protein
MREHRLKNLAIMVLGVLLINGCAHAQPTKGNKREVVARIQELQATPTTPENVRDRSRQIKQLLNMLEQKRGRAAVEQVASRETQQEFVRAINSDNYATACRIADDIISRLAEFAGTAKAMRGPRTIDVPPAGEKAKALTYEYFDSPFGFHSAYYDTSPFKNAKEIGVTWDRGTGIGGYMTPMPQFGKGKRPNKDEVIKQARTRIRDKVYSFDSFDKYIRQVPRGMNIVQNIGPTKKEVVPWVKFLNKPGSWLPKDEYMDYYLTFVERAVERYDGDGKNDMPGLKSPIKYWQIGNEPHYRQNMRDLAKLVRMTQPVIMGADPEAKVILGGASLQPLVDDYLEQLRGYYYPILDALGGKCIDVFDFHWYGKADGDYKKIRVVYKDIRKNLDLRGYKDTEIWVTEMGTYSGAPGGKYDWPVQTEEEQAMDLLKRYVYSLSLGIKKIFWAWGMVEGFPPADNNHFFDHTGLIYDGRRLGSKDVDRGRGVKKLAFYTYKIMTDTLEGADWDRIEKLEERDGIHIYKVAKQGKYIWVAWNDNKDEKQIVISGIKSKGVRIVEAVPKHESGKDIADVEKAFRIKLKTVDKEKVSLTLDQIPVFVEEE